MTDPEVAPEPQKTETESAEVVPAACTPQTTPKKCKTPSTTPSKVRAPTDATLFVSGLSHGFAN